VQVFPLSEEVVLNLLYLQLKRAKKATNVGHQKFQADNSHACPAVAITVIPTPIFASLKELEAAGDTRFVLVDRQAPAVADGWRLAFTNKSELYTLREMAVEGGDEKGKNQREGGLNMLVRDLGIWAKYLEEAEKKRVASAAKEDKHKQEADEKLGG
jgi:hypothetical protein